MELKGPPPPNPQLDQAQFLLQGEFPGPESLATRKDEVYTGLIGGDVVRIKDGKVSVVARFGSECGKIYYSYTYINLIIL